MSNIRSPVPFITYVPEALVMRSFLRVPSDCELMGTQHQMIRFDDYVHPGSSPDLTAPYVWTVHNAHVQNS